MTVDWTRTALRDLENVHAYIFVDSRIAAAETVDALLSGVAALEQHPEMGRKGRLAGIRELVFTPYVVAYRVRRGAIEIVAVIHGARKWPERL